LQGLQSIHDELKKRNVEILAISADPPDKLREHMLSKGFSFPLLADPKLEVISRFGLVHPGGNPFGGDIARPAVIMLRENREPGFVLLTENWRVRPTPRDILREIEKLSP